MSAFSFGYAGQHNRVSSAEPAYLEVTAAAERETGGDVGAYAARCAAAARAAMAARHPDFAAADLAPVAAPVELPGAQHAAGAAVLRASEVVLE